MPITVPELEAQFNRAKALGWLPYFLTAGYAMAPADLMAVASRETNMRSELGDFRGTPPMPHGFGIMQIDKGSFPHYCATAPADGWRNVRGNIRFGAMVLQMKFNGVRDSGRVPERDIRHCALAAYNADINRVLDAYAAGDPDRPTTGHDYGADCMRRAVVFRRLLGD